MAESANFTSVLDEVNSKVDRPPPYPQGSYVFLVEGQPKFSQVGQDKKDVADFQLKFLQVFGEQPSQEEVANFPGGVLGKTVRVRFFLTEAAKWRLDKFLIDDLGIEGEMSRRQRLAQAQGRQVIGVIKHRPSEDGTTIFAEVSETSKV